MRRGRERGGEVRDRHVPVRKADAVEHRPARCAVQLGASKNLDINITGSSNAHGLIGQNMDASSSSDGALDVHRMRASTLLAAQA